MTTVGLPAAGDEKDPVWMPRKGGGHGVGVAGAEPAEVETRTTSPSSTSPVVGTNPSPS